MLVKSDQFSTVEFVNNTKAHNLFEYNDKAV